jgi:ribonuclease P protein component
MPEAFLLKRTAITQRFTWTKGERLKSRKLIERVFREGRHFSLFPFRVSYLIIPHLPAAALPADPGVMTRAPFPPVQAGFGASSRNFKKAVDRNRIKRLTREAYRLQRQALLNHLTGQNRSLAVFFIYTGKELPDYGTVTEKIGVALQKLIRESLKETGP